VSDGRALGTLGTGGIPIELCAGTVQPRPFLLLGLGTVAWFVALPATAVGASGRTRCAWPRVGAFAFGAACLPWATSPAGLDARDGPEVRTLEVRRQDLAQRDALLADVLPSLFSSQECAPALQFLIGHVMYSSDQGVYARNTLLLHRRTPGMISSEPEHCCAWLLGVDKVPQALSSLTPASLARALDRMDWASTATLWR